MNKKKTKHEVILKMCTTDLDEHLFYVHLIFCIKGSRGEAVITIIAIYHQFLESSIRSASDYKNANSNLFSPKILRTISNDAAVVFLRHRLVKISSQKPFTKMELLR